MRWFFLLLFVFFAGCGYHRHDITRIPQNDKIKGRLLFIALDGVSYDLMKELKHEGLFEDFQEPVPLVVPFPSATTIGFTGIFQPAGVGPVVGYESRFYDFSEERIRGGTPWDVYKIAIPYKYYFDTFRHRMFEKFVMYAFPGVAGKQDLLRTEKALLESDHQIIFTYLGGTDGAQHLLGKNRMKTFMRYMNGSILRLKKKYQEKFNEELEIVFFSDHGFHFDHMKMISGRQIKQKLAQLGLAPKTRLAGDKNVVMVKFGLLSAGVVMFDPKMREKTATALATIDGFDLTFWPEGNRIYIVNHQGEKAYFEYENGKSKVFRYQIIKGDPLGYSFTKGKWLGKSDWLKHTWNHDYPDAGYRLHDAFHRLVQNKAQILFSLKSNYQFGAPGAHLLTKLKWRHKGTHGALTRQESQGLVMTDQAHKNFPKYFRYDEMLPYFIPGLGDSSRN